MQSSILRDAEFIAGKAMVSGKRKGWEVANRNVVLGILAALVAVQLFDIAIHVSTGQAEAIRILSNVILGLWALLSVFGNASAKAGIIAIGIYVALNAVFIAMNGITNPDQDGALRITLFVLVGLSVALALWLRAKTRRD